MAGGQRCGPHAGREGRHADGRGWRWALLGRIPGTVLGVAVVAVASDRASWAWRWAGWSSSRSGCRCGRSRSRIGRRSLVTAGLIGGVTGTATSDGGPPLALLYQHRPGREVRATLAAYFCAGALLSPAPGRRGRVRAREASSRWSSCPAWRWASRSGRCAATSTPGASARRSSSCAPRRRSRSSCAAWPGRGRAGPAPRRQPSRRASAGQLDPVGADAQRARGDELARHPQRPEVLRQHGAADGERRERGRAGECALARGAQGGGVEEHLAPEQRAGDLAGQGQPLVGVLGGQPRSS